MLQTALLLWIRWHREMLQHGKKYTADIKLCGINSVVLEYIFELLLGIMQTGFCWVNASQIETKLVRVM
jgi:hypothetical protein